MGQCGLRGNLKIILPLILGSSFFVSPSQSFAQEEDTRTLSLSPVHYEFRADPGETIIEKMKVYNPTDRNLEVTMEKEDFQPRGETGQVIVRETDNPRYSLKNWVTVAPGEFTLGPREEKFVQITIVVPQGATPGGKYVSVLAVMNSGGVGEGTGSLISQKVGALILLSVNGPVTENLEIKDIQAPAFSEYGPIPIDVRFANQGTVHVRPRGFVSVTDMLGRKIADLEFSGQNVIPGAVRKIGVSLDKKWLWGKFSIRVVGDYGQGLIPLNSPVAYFWVIPWKALLGALAVLLVLGIFFWKSRRRWLAALRIIIKGKAD